MKGNSFGAFQAVIAVVYLCLMTNVLLVVACLPLVLLLMTTDPTRSWPFVALVAPLCTPALTAAFSAFRAHAYGGEEVIRSFLAGYRATWRRAITFGGLATLVLLVLLVDVRYFSDTAAGVVVIPLLFVSTGLVLGAVPLGLTAVAEVPTARLRNIVKVSIYFAVSRWYLTVVSVIVLATYFWLFTSMPGIALGIATAPAFYVVWSNSRHSLLPVLDLAPREAS